MSGSRPNFRIIEGDTFDYDGFNNDYADGVLSKSELLEKYNLTEGQYWHRSKYAKECTGVSRDKPVDMMYIYTYPDYYLIRKMQGNDLIYCGRYKDLKTAKFVRDYLVENDLKPALIKECRKLYGIAPNRHGGNQYKDSPLRKEALSKFKEFKRLYLGGEHSYSSMLSILGFTRHQYSICLSKLKETYPDVRKPLVRGYK